MPDSEYWKCLYDEALQMLSQVVLAADDNGPDNPVLFSLGQEISIWLDDHGDQ